MSANWPLGLITKLKSKLALTDVAWISGNIQSSNESNGIEQAFIHKECWIFHQADYSALRKNPKMKNFVDLPSTQVDAVDARKIAKSMNINEQNIF